MREKIFLLLFTCLLFVSCDTGNYPNTGGDIGDMGQEAILATFDGKIDLTSLANYADQEVPNYINKDNTEENVITDLGATLGRVLFYDKNLSVDNSISCASCHQQAFAFSDGDAASTGVNGTTGRHSMRLVNTRFADEGRFFWDERASSLEEQTTQPIQDHIEMGFSGEDGNDDIIGLCTKLEDIGYYQELFKHVYGDSEVTEARVQQALAQFIRSIQSFDSKYDQGLSSPRDEDDDFSNFTSLENEGKSLFMQRSDFNNNGVRVGGGLGCNACHRAPEFDIDPNSRNNGIIASLSGNGADPEVTRSPSLRDLFNVSGRANGPFMHNGFSEDFEDVLEHYNDIANVEGLDRRLAPRGNPQNLAMTEQEKDAITAFIMTLSGSNIYVDEKWSDPFEE